MKRELRHTEGGTRHNNTVEYLYAGVVETFISGQFTIASTYLSIQHLYYYEVCSRYLALFCCHLVNQACFKKHTIYWTCRNNAVSTHPKWPANRSFIIFLVLAQLLYTICRNHSDVYIGVHSHHLRSIMVPFNFHSHVLLFI